MVSALLKKPQLDYLNNLKIFLITLVVLQHSAGAYTAGENWLIINPLRVSLFKPVLTINSTFFMGLFFFISAFFVPTSLLRYRRNEFISNKIKRLIIPTIIGILTVLPLSYYAQVYPDNFANFYITYFTSGAFNFGHMWFLVQLFIYTCLFALFYWLIPGLILKQNKPLTWLQVISFITVLCALSYLVALISPINQWYWKHLVEPYHLPQYISLFTLGIIAYRRDWLDLTSYRFGLFWLIISVLAISYRVIIDINGIDQNLLSKTLWTSVQCVSLCIGLLIMFREFGNYSNPALKFLSDNAFAVYIIHVPVVVWLQRGLLELTLRPINKFLITLIVSYCAAYGLSYLFRKSRLISQFI